MGTDEYHIQVSHHLRVGTNALNEYDQYAVYLAILNHGAIDMFLNTALAVLNDKFCIIYTVCALNCVAEVIPVHRLPLTAYPDRQPQVAVLLSAQNCSQPAPSHRLPTQANYNDAYNRPLQSRLI